MRNLKKVLSLTLALVMMLGMMTFAGAAQITSKDLTDMNDVKNKEAVTLLVDLGIIAGRDTGAFDPKGTLTRAEFAKMIYVAKMGADDKAANFVGAATGLTDTKMWAEGYINYCFSTGIVAGRTATVFDPDGKVKTVEAAKMLLVALGFDSEAQGYIKDALWSVNVMQDAKKAGLMAGVKDAADVSLSRDSAAQMIYNALFAKTVTNERQKDFTGKWYISKTTENTTTLGEEVYDLVKVTGIVKSVADGKADFDAVTPEGKTGTVMLAAVRNAKVPVANDMVGKKVVIYMKATLNNAGEYTVDKAYSSVAIAGVSVVLGTSTNGTPIVGYDGSSVKNDLTTKKTANKAFIAELDMGTTNTAHYKVTAYLNGKLQDNDGTEQADIDADILAAADLAGSIVELIDADGNGLADIIKVTKQSMATLTADPSTKTVNDVLQVKVPGVPALNSLMDADKVVGYEGLKKDDVVLYYKDEVTNVYTLEKAASIEGKVEATKTGEIRVGGTFYGASGLTTFKTTDVNTTDTYTFYLDNGKNIIKADAITSTASKDYAVILDVKFVTGATMDTGDYGQAKLLFADGTTKIVTVSKLGGQKVNGVASDTTIDSGEFLALKPAATVAFDFYTYVVDADGKYELTASATSRVATENITNGKVLFDTKTVGNANTVFLVKSGTGDDTTYKMYKGIAAVPTILLDDAKLAYNNAVVTKDGVATYVFLNAKSVEGTTSDAIYFFVTDHTEAISYPKNGTVPAYTEVPVYINGEVVNAKFTTAPTENKMYKVTSLNDAGHYAAITVVDRVEAGAGDSATKATSHFVKGVNVVSGGTLSVGVHNDAAAKSTLRTFTYDASTKAYFIDKAGVMSAVAVADIAVDPSNYVLVLATGTVADVVYVQEVLSDNVALAAKASIKVGAADPADVTLTDGAGDQSGVDATNAKKVTLTKADLTAEAALTITIKAADSEATVSYVSGTVPTKTATASEVLTNAIIYKVTAENGAVCFYEVTLALTSAGL